MNPQGTREHNRAEAAALQSRLGGIDEEIRRLEAERVHARRRLEILRSLLSHCPRCGRERDFLTDEGGVLIHVLEDPDDTDLLTPGKPLYCPGCGEVFLFSGARTDAPRPVAAARARPTRRR